MTSEIFKLNGRNALITGAAGLLGLEHAHSLLEIGANLVLTDIDTSKLNTYKRSLESEYPFSKIYVYSMDVTNEDSIIRVHKEL